MCACAARVEGIKIMFRLNWLQAMPSLWACLCLLVASVASQSSLCTAADNTCSSPNDGFCDDGYAGKSGGGTVYSGPPAHNAFCPFNSDCSDCGGPRVQYQPSPPPPQPSPPPPPPSPDLPQHAPPSPAMPGGLARPCTWIACDDTSDLLCALLANQDLPRGETPSTCTSTEQYSSMAVVLPDRQPQRVGGSIPTQIGRLASLRLLDASFNSISGTLPTQVGMLHQLRSLNIFHNRISGALPTQLAGCTSLLNLKVFANRVSGTLPTQVGGLAALGYRDGMVASDKDLPQSYVPLLHALPVTLPQSLCPPMHSSCRAPSRVLPVHPHTLTRPACCSPAPPGAPAWCSRAGTHSKVAPLMASSSAAPPSKGRTH